ncbi:MAG: YceI family protein [Akkermansiaceae bacterium]|jgi:polyisoprenoid-binding protein YceI
MDETTTAEELREATDRYQLLDVRLADDYEAGHLEGAKGNCVFEVAFEGRLTDSAPSKEVLTVVYGANDDSREALMAAEKLERLGYADVRVLKGGFEEASGIISVIQGTPLPASPAEPDGRFVLDLEESYVGWTGRNLINKHHGRIGIREGELVFDNGTLAGGSVVLDMNAITCVDLAGTDLHDVLIDHLKGHDFFDVDVFPTAEVAVKEADEQQATIELTMKGVSGEVVIPLEAGLNEEGCPVTQAAFSINRTKWNVLYGSKRFFNRLAGHLVNEMVEIELRLITKKAV